MKNLKKAQLKKTLDIGEVAKHSGLPPSTLRYYEEKGLIRSIGRHGLKRLFDHRIIERLEFIALGRHAGFSLEEIAGMFTTDGQLEVDRSLLISKSKEIEKNMKRLSAIQNLLEHVANCKAPSHLECPKFLRLLDIAGKTQDKLRIDNVLKTKKSKIPIRRPSISE